MIFHFLPLGRHSAEEGPAAQDKILTLPVKLAIHKKVFLFRSYCGADLRNIGFSKQLQDAEGLMVQSSH